MDMITPKQQKPLLGMGAGALSNVKILAHLRLAAGFST
jgi:hypothetical protein